MLSKKIIIRLLFPFLLITLIILSLISIGPPEAVPSSASNNLFSADRAMEHVEAIASSPRPVGSEGHARAQDYITGTLSKIGLEWEIQATTVVSTRWGLPFDSANVRNIIATLPGTANTRALLLSAHYDSVPNSPGASDDASGVAVLLETARALKAGTPLKNDIIFLFTDGEEGGLLGAKAFIDEHHRRKDVGLALNFDSRGSRGLALMYDTSPGNRFIIQEFAKATLYPIASSLFYEAAELMRTSTDFRIFREAGIAGFNFAFIDAVPYYHTPADTIYTIDRRSIQHQGSYAFSLARHFGNIDIMNTEREDAVYFNTFGTHIVSYSYKLVLPFFIIIAILFVGVIATGIKKGLLSYSGIVKGLIFFLINLIIIPILASGLWMAIRKMHPEYQMMRTSDTYNADYYRAALVLFGAGLAMILHNLYRKRVGLFDLTAGALSAWFIMLIISSLFFPGASYIFAWPLLFTMIGLGLLFQRKDPEAINPANGIILLACAVPIIVLGSPIPYISFMFLQLSRTGVVVCVVLFLLGLLIPQLEWALSASKRLLPALCLIASFALILAAFFSSGFDRSHPKQYSLTYGLDVASRNAYWLSEDSKITPPLSSLFSGSAQTGTMDDFLPDKDVIVRRSRADVVELPSPTATLLEEHTKNGIRSLRIRLISQRQAPWLQVFITSNTRVVRSFINGKPVEEKTATGPVPEYTHWGFRHIGLPKEGIEWTLEVSESDIPIEVTVTDQSFELPRIGENVPPQLSDNMMSSRSWISNSTLVRAAYKF